jgi:hypothetical protein
MKLIKNATMKASKNSTLKFAFVTLLAAVILIAISFYSCEKEVITPNKDLQSNSLYEPDFILPIPSSVCGKIDQKSIFLLNGVAIGDALIYNDNRYFYILLTTRNEYYMKDAYMHICKNFDEIPMDDYSNPAILDYTYSIKDQPISTVRKFRVKLNEMSGSSYISVTAEVKNMSIASRPIKFESAWIEGRQIGLTIKGTVFHYEKGLCLEDHETSISE